MFDANFKIRKILRQKLSFLKLLEYLDIKIYPGNYIFSIYNSSETKPSLYINDEFAVFKCFSTDKGGDIVKFYMDYKKVKFVKAIEDLIRISKKCSKDSAASNSNVKTNNRGTLTESQKLSQKGKIKKPLLHRRVYKFIEKILSKEKLPKEVDTYLKSNIRKLSSQTIIKFRIMYVNDIEKFLRKLKTRFSPSALKLCGITNEKGNLVFFYHRIIIPYIENSEIVYLRGHRIPDYDKTIYKYIGLKGMSSKRIFNVDVLSRMKPGDKLWVCEGEFDTMVADQVGANAIGFPGVTNIPFEELKNLNIGQYKIYIAFDKDNAGERAAKMFVDELGIVCKRLKLRNGKDLTEAYNV